MMRKLIYFLAAFGMVISGIWIGFSISSYSQDGLAFGVFLGIVSLWATIGSAADIIALRIEALKDGRPEI